ncbi:MAG: peptidylprolyl isomerase [Candidatus Woesearchaeota archaeon]
MEIKDGNKVKIEYEGKLETGEVFDASAKHGQPLEIDVGKHQVIPGFEKALIGMKKGEEKEITLKPEEAYGQKNPQMVKKVPREQLPKDQEPKAGMMLMITLPTGQNMPAMIAEVSPEDVTLDLNHPLAGKTLIFKIKVVEIS